MYHIVTAKVGRDGKKAKNEKYLTISHSVTESETILAEEFKNIENLTLDVTASKRLELAGFLEKENRKENDPIKTYLVTVKVQIGDEDKPRTKKEKFLVEADTDIEASKTMLAYFKEAMYPIEVDKIEYSNFVDVLPRED